MLHIMLSVVTGLAALIVLLLVIGFLGWLFDDTVAREVSTLEQIIGALIVLGTIIYLAYLVGNRILMMIG